MFNCWPCWYSSLQHSSLQRTVKYYVLMQISVNLSFSFFLFFFLLIFFANRSGQELTTADRNIVIMKKNYIHILILSGRSPRYCLLGVCFFSTQNHISMPLKSTNLIHVLYIQEFQIKINK